MLEICVLRGASGSVYVRQLAVSDLRLVVVLLPLV
jgi:hypothetical protein